MRSSLIKKRIAELVAAAMFCAGVALAGTMALAALSIANEDRTALAQESGSAGGEEPSALIEEQTYSGYGETNVITAPTLPTVTPSPTPTAAP